MNEKAKVDLALWIIYIILFIGIGVIWGYKFGYMDCLTDLDIVTKEIFELTDID